MSSKPIISVLRERLLDAGARRWPQIAAEASASLPPDKAMTAHSLRKIAYGDRKNPGLQDVQALLDYFGDVDAGRRALPEPAAQEAA